MKKLRKLFSFIMMVTLIMINSNAVRGAEGEDLGSWETKASMPTARTALGVAEVDGKIYAIGGYNNSELNVVEAYDIATDTWITKASMPTARWSLDVAEVNGKIYAIGGQNLENEYLDTVEEYDPATDTWTTKASMPTPRHYLSVAEVNGKIYAIGGSSGLSYNNIVEEYDPQTNTWTTKASMPTARGTMGVVEVEGKIYAIGGYNSDGVWEGAVEEYNPTTDMWTTKASMPTARRALGVTVASGKIYAIGGEHFKDMSHVFLDTVEEYDPQADTWTTKASMPTKRGYLRSIGVNDNIYVIGGKNWSDGKISTVDVFMPSSTVINAPTSLKATTSSSTIVLNWDTVTDADSYTILKSTTSGVIDTVIASDLTETTYSDSDVIPGVTYYYAVRAVKDGVESANSNIASAMNPLKETLELNSIDKIRVGEDVSVDVKLHNANNIYAEDVTVTYNQEIFEYTGHEEIEGLQVVKSINHEGTLRFIIASKGEDKSVDGSETIVTLKFKAKKVGEGKIDALKARIANIEAEWDLIEIDCGETSINVEGYLDVNRTGEFTLLDLAIDGFYYNKLVADTNTEKYDADVVVDGTINDDDLVAIVNEMLSNTHYEPNK
ncbi:hypothetical protein HZI73_25595 [Vallitalea pronyensis]|uniref:Fibronectin type-III domain-containing protein n=1 Tax=Vallitalea pronyensis TaxID=1348613 RepID=A0A8J8MPW4_9FIRM|nr:kelch repeat-containing protein [Vallitalea pronyensis]QUI25464.1 hypothetical protein HZI73_25595 [Vallitalea pronyensis]